MLEPLTEGVILTFLNGGWQKKLKGSKWILLYCNTGYAFLRRLDSYDVPCPMTSDNLATIELIEVIQAIFDRRIRVEDPRL